MNHAVPNSATKSAIGCALLIRSVAAALGRRHAKNTTREERQQEEQPEEPAGLANWLTGAAWLCLLPQFSQCQCHSVCCMPQHNFLRVYVCVCVCWQHRPNAIDTQAASQPGRQAGKQRARARSTARPKITSIRLSLRPFIWLPAGRGASLAMNGLHFLGVLFDQKVQQAETKVATFAQADRQQQQQQAANFIRQTDGMQICSSWR